MAELISKIGMFLSNSQNFYFYIAVTSSLFFAIQFVLALIGAHAGHDVDIHVDHDIDLSDIDNDVDINTEASDLETTDYGSISDVNWFSIKSITAFVMFFGWAGFFWGDKGWVGLLIAFLCGLVMMIITSLMIFFMLKMQQSGNILRSDLIGQKAEVYLAIPAKRSGTGKITVSLPHCTREVKAMSDEEIPRGVPVRIASHLEGDCYLVKKL